MIAALESSSLFFKKHTGIPYYIQNLNNGLAGLDDIELYHAFRLKKVFSNHDKNQKKLLSQKHYYHVANKILSTQRFDIVHSLHTPFLNVKNSIKIATVHDLAVHLPEFKSFNLTSSYFQKKRLELFAEINKNADAIITVSEVTKKDFLKFFKYPEDKIHVVPLAASLTPSKIDNEEDSLLKKFNLSKKGYYISLGGVSVRKNTLNLVKGFAKANGSKDKFLVITGKIEGNYYQTLYNFIIENKIEDKVWITGYLSEKNLSLLFQNAGAFLFPTIYEGFGIPILEAMLNKLPILTSITGAAPETSNGHAILVDPFNPQSIAEGIDSLTEITEKQLSLAFNYASTFTWENTAILTKGIYEKYV